MRKEYTLTGYNGTTVIYNGSAYTYCSDIYVEETSSENDDGYVYNHLYAWADVRDNDGNWYTLNWESFDGVFNYDSPSGLLESDPPIGLEA